MTAFKLATEVQPGDRLDLGKGRSCCEVLDAHPCAATPRIRLTVLSRGKITYAYPLAHARVRLAEEDGR